MGNTYEKEQPGQRKKKNKGIVLLYRAGFPHRLRVRKISCCTTCMEQVTDIFAGLLLAEMQRVAVNWDSQAD